MVQNYLYALLHVLLRTVNSPLAGCHFPFSRIHRWRAAQMSSFCRNEVVIAPFHRNTAPFNAHDRRTWPACSRGRAQSRRTIAVAFCVDQDTIYHHLDEVPFVWWLRATDRAAETRV